MFRKKPPTPSIPPEAMIVGLGNPGPEYAGTRHNVGFDLIDQLAKKHHIRVDIRKHRAVYGQGIVEGKSVLLVKPLTYMNLSGQAVSTIAKAFGIKPASILVVADELDLPLARVRMKPKGGPGGHNGHRSLIASLGTQEYPRIRIGIGKGGPDTIDHVLNRFRPDERKAIEEALDLAKKGCEIWLTDGIEKAASFVNTSSRGDAKGDEPG